MSDLHIRKDPSLIDDDPFPSVPPIRTMFGIRKIGFTGTREGMTDAQKHCVYHLLHEYRPEQAHHGDCVGADANFHQLIRELTRDVWIVGHPPILTKARAYCTFDEEREPGEYHARDRNIVNETDMLIATPKGTSEELRSGTWTTVRYARSISKPILLVWLDGSITEENT